MPKQVNVRALEEKDLNGWLRLRLLLWDHTTEDAHRSEMVEIIEHLDSQFVGVAENEDGELVGFLEAGIRAFAEDCETDRIGYLEGWYVDSEYRQHGIGRELVLLAENWARSRGCKEMASDAEVGNDVSLDAHRKLGYTITSRLVHMRKEL